MEWSCNVGLTVVTTLTEACQYLLTVALLDQFYTQCGSVSCSIGYLAVGVSELS